VRNVFQILRVLSGRSMRIFKSEMKEMSSEEKKANEEGNTEK
jgi:Sec-independent protein translocase protein TatA